MESAVFAAGRICRMKTLPRMFLCLTILAASLWSFPAKASELIYSQFSDNQSTFGPSQLWTTTGVNSEVADEFNVVANIDRVSAGGFVWGTVNFQGVYVRSDYRGRGVFRALYDMIRERARTTDGVLGLRLYVERENHGALATYRRLGMETLHYDIMQDLVSALD